MAVELSPFLKSMPLQVLEGVLDYVEDQDDYVINYDQIARDDLDKKIMPDEVKDVLLNLCEILVTEKGVVVDVGAAYGHILHRVPARQKVAVDISLEYLKRIDPSILRLRANAEQLPLADGVADTVICTDVFEHVRNEKNLSSEIARVLKPGGRLLLATPWEQDLSVYESKEYIEKYKKYKYVHLRSVDERMVRENFPRFTLRSRTLITIGMKHMTLKPYPIMFMQLVKANRTEESTHAG